MLRFYGDVIGIMFPLSYSTVSFVRCSVGSFKVDAFFCFTITIRRPILHMPHYTEYQFYLYETILKLRDKGMTFNQIADHLNKKGILSVRGKKFRGAHVHSIVKKKRMRDEKLEREYPEVWSDFYLDVYDKRIVMKL